jgi:inward rectifier potassium channel
MPSNKKINPFSKSNPDTGFGVQAAQIGGRFINKDGTFNLRKEGLSLWKRVSLYSQLLNLSWLQFFGIILLFYLAVNIFFTLLYIMAGARQLQGLLAVTEWGKIKEIFYFSTQTFTTVGYGRINPVSDGADVIASLESLAGWLSFALVTGLLYGRFTRPRGYIAFSEQALISPYKDGLGLIFRMVPYKTNHYLTDARVIVTTAFKVAEANKEEYKFYQLPLERSRIDMFNMNWTVVHPIDRQSPLLNFTEDDFRTSDMELYVQIRGYDPVFSNTVMQLTSYTWKEIVWGAKFRPMYHESADGFTTILELNKLNDYELVVIEAKELNPE